MAEVPSTSTTLLRDLADSQHARWVEFLARYRPMMEAYMRAEFSELDAGEIIQETLIALVGALPNYTIRMRRAISTITRRGSFGAGRSRRRDGRHVVPRFWRITGKGPERTKCRRTGREELARVAI